MFPIFLLLLPITLAQTQQEKDQNNYCPFPIRQTSCLPSLSTSPQLYAQCRTTPCYLFLPEPPFILVPSPPPSPPYKPFPCASPAPYSGLTFTIHSNLPHALCIYAGPDCTFNDLIHFTTTFSSTYRFAITGILIHTPLRMCNHTPAAPVVEDTMVIIGNADTGRRVDHLIRPFASLTWVIVALCIALILTVAFYIAFESRGKLSVVNAIFLVAGDSSSVIPKVPSEEHRFHFSRYALSMTLLKFAVAGLTTLVALFYEAGVVNFLFQENNAELGKRITRLSATDLRSYSVLKDSALEQVWNATVNPDGTLYDPINEQPPWKRCERSEQCIRWVADQDNEVMFDVTFGVTARYLIQKVSSCAKLSIFTTKDILYHFTAGMFFTQNIPPEYRLKVSRLLTGMRIDGTLGDLIDESLDSSVCRESLDPQLGPLIVAVPLALVVLPLLSLSVIIILTIKRKKPRNDTPGEPPKSQDNTLQQQRPSVSSGDIIQRGSTVELEEINLS